MYIRKVTKTRDLYCYKCYASAHTIGGSTSKTFFPRTC